MSFVDLAEVQHWVTCRTEEVGTATRNKSIFVTLRRHPALSDWLPAD